MLGQSEGSPTPKSKTVIQIVSGQCTVGGQTRAAEMVSQDSGTTPMELRKRGTSTMGGNGCSETLGHRWNLAHSTGAVKGLCVCVFQPLRPPLSETAG